MFWESKRKLFPSLLPAATLGVQYTVPDDVTEVPRLSGDIGDWNFVMKSQLTSGSANQRRVSGLKGGVNVASRGTCPVLSRNASRSRSFKPPKSGTLLQQLTIKSPSLKLYPLVPFGDHGDRKSISSSQGLRAASW
jgi:hypothetical protein